jgi:hypothetical protein
MPDDEKTTRRRCLRLIGAAGAGAVIPALAASARAFTLPATPHERDESESDSYDIIVTRVKHDYPDVGARGAKWNVYPGADRNLLEEFAKIVHCKVKLAPGLTGMSPDYGDDTQFNAVADFASMETLTGRPFLFLTGEGRLVLTEAEKANLKRAVNEGGFLLIDDCVFAPTGDFLFQSACKELEAIFGIGAVVKIPLTHEIFNNVFDLSAIGLPFCQGQNHGAHGVFIGERLAVFVSATDLHCGWADRNHVWFPNPSLGVHGYKEAIEMGINILMYAMSR